MSEHGTANRYYRGCRCDACRAAGTAAKAAQRERRKIACTKCGKPRTHPSDSRGAAVDSGLCIDCWRASRTVTHGTTSAYRHGCRCDECRAAIRDYNRERVARRVRSGWRAQIHNENGYSNGCRCDECKAAWSHYTSMRGLRERRTTA